MKPTIKLENKVQIPDLKYQKFPFEDMKIGQSFVADVNVRFAAAQWKRRNPGWNYLTRSIGDGQCRIWRTA